MGRSERNQQEELQTVRPPLRAGRRASIFQPLRPLVDVSQLPFILITDENVPEVTCHADHLQSVANNRTACKEEAGLSRRHSLMSQEISDDVMSDDVMSSQSRNHSVSNRGRRTGELEAPQVSLHPPSSCAIGQQSDKQSELHNSGDITTRDVIEESDVIQGSEIPPWELNWEVTPPQLLASDTPHMLRSASDNTIKNNNPLPSHSNKRQRSVSKLEKPSVVRPGRFSLDNRIKQSSTPGTHSNLLVTTERGSSAGYLLKSRKKKSRISMDMRSPSLWRALRKTSADEKYEHIADIKVEFGEYVKNRRCSKETHSHEYREDYEAKTRNKLLRYEFKKDEEYTGEIADNKAHGHGVFLYKDCKFGGLWDCGYEYIGCYTWPNNVRYSGFWAKGRRNGEGIEQHKNYVYKGEWMEDLKEGYGVITSHSGSKYEGTWHRDLQEGCGIETYRDGSFYAGQFDAGQRSGYGVKIENPTEQQKFVFSALLTENGLNAETGGTEINQIRNPLMSALDVISSLDIEVSNDIFQKATVLYMGQWKDDARYGFGIEKTSRGQTFRGTFKDNKKHGQGVLIDQNGLEHCGKWSKNVCKVNKRILTSTAQRSAVAGEEAAKLAKEKAVLSRGRAIGARKCALEATDSEARANEQFIIAEERRAETLNQIRLGNIAINVVATIDKDMKPQSPGTTLQINLAKQAINLRSKISDMTNNMVKSPKMNRIMSATGSSGLDTSPNSSEQSSPRTKTSKLNRPSRTEQNQITTRDVTSQHEM